MNLLGLIGGVSPESTIIYYRLMSVGARAGADGVILGCTEFCMILSQDHCDPPVFDTTALHAAAACRSAFGEA